MAVNNTFNFFAGESLIRDAISTLVLPEYLFTYESNNTFDGFEFALPDNERVSLSIESKGYSVPDSSPTRMPTSPRGKSIIIQEWRVNVLTPSELYSTVAGVTLVDIIKNVTSISSDKHCINISAINDVHQFHEPIFDSEYCMLHATFAITVLF